MAERQDKANGNSTRQGGLTPRPAIWSANLAVRSAAAARAFAVASAIEPPRGMMNYCDGAGRGKSEVSGSELKIRSRVAPLLSLPNKPALINQVSLTLINRPVLLVSRCAEVGRALASQSSVSFWRATSTLSRTWCAAHQRRARDDGRI